MSRRLQPTAPQLCPLAAQPAPLYHYFSTILAVAVVTSFAKLLLARSHHIDLLHIQIVLVMQGRSYTNSSENVLHICPTCCRASDVPSVRQLAQAPHGRVEVALIATKTLPCKGPERLRERAPRSNGPSQRWLRSWQRRNHRCCSRHFLAYTCRQVASQGPSRSRHPQRSRRRPPFAARGASTWRARGRHSDMAKSTGELHVKIDLRSTS